MNYVITLWVLRIIYVGIDDVVHGSGANNGKKCYEEGGMLLIFCVLVTYCDKLMKYSERGH